VLEAARLLFVRDGYVATTIEAIAAEAGVSAKTVYDAFATKAGVLRGVWDLALKGDTDDAPVADRPWFLEAFEQTDARAMARLVAHNSVGVKVRVGDIFRVIRDASSVDDDSAALWGLIQSDFHANQRSLVEAMAKRKGLRRGLSVDDATDVLWTLNHPDTWLLLHHERGWSPERFERWLLDSIERLLLKAD
jgi:AcrR family transcriptional regulator